MTKTCYEKVMFKEILVSKKKNEKKKKEEELSDIKFKKLKKALIYFKNKLIDSDQFWFVLKC